MGALLAERSMLAVAWQGLVGLLQGVHSLLLLGHPLGHQVDRVCRLLPGVAGPGRGRGCRACGGSLFRHACLHGAGVAAVGGLAAGWRAPSG